VPVPGGLDDSAPPRIAVLVSGRGTILDALAVRAREGTLGGPLGVVIADRSGVPALDVAVRHHLPTVTLPRSGTPPERWGQELDGTLRSFGVTLVVLDGFLSVLPPNVIARWRGRILNVHPSLLPRRGGPGMYGARVHAAVLAAGDAETGVTVHLVTGSVDAGPILVQRSLRIEPGDTPESLRERLRPLEVEALTEAIAAAVRG
jgi:phosphoribosylglycinamide formyltransferase-1